MLNKQSHGVTKNQLVDDLHSLFDQHLIVAENIDGEPHNLRRPQIENALAEKVAPRQALYYKLTPGGGAAWEAFARPNWDHFIGQFHDENSATPPFDCRGTVLHTLEWYFRSVRFRLSSNGGAPQDAIPSRLEWDTVAPFRATYWKTIPSAHRVRAWLPPEAYADFTQNPHVFDAIKSAWYRWGG